jgi:hypothetical protein
MDGERSGPRAGTDGQWSVSLSIRWYGELVRDCGGFDVAGLRVWVGGR